MRNVRDFAVLSDWPLSFIKKNMPQASDPKMSSKMMPIAILNNKAADMTNRIGLKSHEYSGLFGKKNLFPGVNGHGLGV